jgi:hypothetical protein
VVSTGLAQTGCSTLPLRRLSMWPPNAAIPAETLGDTIKSKRIAAVAIVVSSPPGPVRSQPLEDASVYHAHVSKMLSPGLYLCASQFLDRSKWRLLVLGTNLFFVLGHLRQYYR